MMAAKVAVTGATGLVGRALTDHLRTSGGEVLPLVRSATGAENELVTGDLAQAILDPGLLRGVDSVVHLAARTHVLNETEPDPLAAYRRINVEGTGRLLDAALAAGVRRFVYMSSVKAAGEWTEPSCPFTADSLPRPEDGYGISKLEAEALVRRRCEAAGVEWVIIRPPLVYGPGVTANFERLICLVETRLPLPLGAIHNRRSIISVRSLVEATAAALGAPGAANRLLMVSDATVSTPDLLRSMARALRIKVRLVPVPPALLLAAAKLIGRQGEMSRLCGNLEIDSGPSMAALGWTPSQSLDEAIRETIVSRRTERERTIQ